MRSKSNGAGTNGHPEANGNGNLNGDHVDPKQEEDEQQDEGEYKPPRASDKLKAGIIYPPREIRSKLTSSIHLDQVMQP